MKTLKRIFPLIFMILLMNTFIVPAYADKVYSNSEIVAIISNENAGFEDVLNKLAKQHQPLSTSDFSPYVTKDFFQMVLQVEFAPRMVLNLTDFIGVINSVFISGFSDVKRLVINLQVYGNVVADQSLLVFFTDGQPAIVFVCSGTNLIDDGKARLNARSLTQIAITDDLKNTISGYISNTSTLYHVDINYSKIK